MQLLQGCSKEIIMDDYKLLSDDCGNIYFICIENCAKKHIGVVCEKTYLKGFWSDAYALKLSCGEIVFDLLNDLILLVIPYKMLSIDSNTQNDTKNRNMKFPTFNKTKYYMQTFLLKDNVKISGILRYCDSGKEVEDYQLVKNIMNEYGFQMKEDAWITKCITIPKHGTDRFLAIYCQGIRNCGNTKFVDFDISIMECNSSALETIKEIANNNTNS